MLFGSNVSHMATGSKKPTVESKALSIAIKRAMATRDLKTPGLAIASTIPYGTLRKILELNTVADYEQLRKIAIALNIPLSEIVADAERLASDQGVIDDFQGVASDQAAVADSKPSLAGERFVVDDEQARVAETLKKLHRGDMDIAALEDEHKYDGDGDDPA